MAFSGRFKGRDKITLTLAERAEVPVVSDMQVGKYEQFQNVTSLLYL
jgi:hypothetical protein